MQGQKQALTHEKLEITGIPFLTNLLEVEIEQTPNSHGRMKVRGYGDAETTQASIEKQFYGQTAELSTAGVPIFSGIITNCESKNDREVDIVEVTVQTGSFILDIEAKSRSFQDITLTYKDVVSQVLSESGGGAIFSVGEDVAIGQPIIQYQETDWEFIKRLASHFTSPIIPDATLPKANIWFGINEQGNSAKFEGPHYKVGVSENYYTQDGMTSGLAPIDFAYFKTRSTDNHNIGDNATINDVKLKICEKQAKLTRSVLEFTYTIGKPSLSSVRTSYNEKAIGMSLKGTVMETAGETVNIKLDIDGETGKADYPYNWTPTAGNLMYCMPKLGTQVSLLLPNEDEREAKAGNSPRENGGSESSCPGMADYNYRIFTTEHDKKMYLYPESMGLTAIGSDTTGQ